MLVAAVVAIAWLGSGNGSPVATAPLTVGVSRPAAVPRGALVLAGESGSLAVALAVTPGRLRATVLSSSGPPKSGLSLSFLTGGHVVRAHPCGAGCYGADVSVTGRVEVRPGGSPPVVFHIPASAKPAGAIVRRADRVLRRLRSLVYVESLRSSPTAGLHTTWRMAAPDRLSYRIKDGAAAVVIGTTRWDRARPGAPWTRSPQEPALRVPQPAWGDRFENAHVLGEGRVDGRPVWIVSFVNPTIPAWFTTSIDRENYQTLRLRMTAAAHFMFHRYVKRGGPLEIAPPA